MKNIAVFASGFGSNFQAIIDSINNNEINAEVKILISDNPKSLAVERAKHNKIDFYSFKPKDFKSKKDYETNILSELESQNIDLIVLAGYMRIIGNTILDKYPDRIINIHPSLLPKYKGVDAIGQAINAKEKETGVTVHYVNKELDSGRIILQEKIQLFEGQTRIEIEENIHRIEHRIYPEAIKIVLEDLDEKSIDKR